MAEHNRVLEPGGQARQAVPRQAVVLRWVGVAVGFLLLLVMIIPSLTRLPVPDESTQLYESVRILKGELPYRDFFDFIGPLGLYLSVIPMLLFGVSLLALRLWALLWLLGCGGLTYRIARRFLPRRWCWALMGWLAVLFIPAGIEVNHHLYSAGLGLVAVWCALKFCEAPGDLKRHSHWVWLAGLFCGLCATTTQSLGVVLFGALLLILGLYVHYGRGVRWAIALKFLMAEFIFPALWPVLFWVVFFVEQDGLDAYVYSTLGWLLDGHYGATTSHWYFLDGWTRLFSYGQALLRHADFAHVRFSIEMLLLIVLTLLKGGLPVLGLLWGAQTLFVRRDALKTGLPSLLLSWSGLDWRLCLLWLAGGGFMLATLSYPNGYLLSIHGFLPLLLATMGVFYVLKTHPAAERKALVVLALLVGVVWLQDLEIAVSTYSRTGFVSYGTRERALSPLGYSPDAVRMQNAITQLIRHNSTPEDAIFVYNSSAEWYLLSGRANPTRYQMLMSVLHSPAQIAEALSKLKEAQPRFVIYDQQDRLDFEQDYRFLKLRDHDYHLKGLEGWLAEDYELIAEGGNLRIYERHSKSPGTR